MSSTADANGGKRHDRAVVDPRADGSLSWRAAVSRIELRDVAVLAATFGVWLTMMTVASMRSDVQVWATNSWERWDTGHYLRIARAGYAFGPCEGVANRTADDFCGSAGWFPGYAYGMRIGERIGPDFTDVGRLISWGSMVVMWCALWFGFLRQRPTGPAVLGMGLAAAFPASVYYGAVFPVSTMVASVVLAVVAMDRGRWLVAGLFGGVAAVVYPSGLLVAAAAAVPLLSPSVGRIADRLRAAALVAGPVVLAYLLVLLNFHRAVDRWDAWFAIQAGYGYERTWPWSTIASQVRSIGDDAVPAAIGLQTVLVLVLVSVAAGVDWRLRQTLTVGERAVLVVGGALWLAPLTLGGDLSLYRAESLLLPLVVVVARAPVRLLAPMLAFSVWNGSVMAELFFVSTLI